MQKNPSLSVLFCTNRYDSFCDTAIASIENQSYKDFEFIIVANCITDVEFHELESRCAAPRIRLFRTDIRGLSFSLNLGLHHCRAPLVARMDADDIAYPHRLARQMSFMSTHSEVILCGSAYDVIDENGNVIGTRFLPEKNDRIRSALWFSNPICHPSVIFRRNIVVKEGGYFGNGGAEDYNLWVRLSENKESIFANIPEALIGYRLPITSAARRSRRAYIQAASTQWEAFLRSGKTKWLFGAILFSAKSVFRATQA